MSYDWVGYFEFAEDTLKRILVKRHPIPADDQTKIRVVISRSYYAAHNKARAKVKDEAPNQERLFSNDSIHRAVIDYFNRCPDNAHQNIGATLEALKGRRIQADYKDSPIAYSLAKDTIGDTRDLLKDLEDL